MNERLVFHGGLERQRLVAYGLTMGFGKLGSALDHAASSAEVNMKSDLDSRPLDIRLYSARNSLSVRFKSLPISSSSI